MKILLVGEYSRLHNTLKEALILLGHEVEIAGSGDGFKNFPVDYNFEAQWSQKPFLRFINKFTNRIFRLNLDFLERGIRFYFIHKRFQNYDLVQLINEAPIQTVLPLEKYLLKKLFQHNKTVFLLSCGIDYTCLHYMMQRQFRYSLLDPYFKDSSLIYEYDYVLKYVNESHRKLHNFVYQRINGVIASDMDYAIPLRENPKLLGLISNPINIGLLPYKVPNIEHKIIIFMGINRLNYHKKGIPFFEKALAIIEQKYPTKVQVIITENIPYQQYIKLYDEAHILLDQIYAYDQGYNALEAMAKGKVVFTGAETEFMDHYTLTERIAINALPDVNQIVAELSYLIENPTKIVTISHRARAFVEQEHDYLKVAEKYLSTWKLAQ